ncbi:acylphosphatase [Noviherbaspirillum denitrificans]|uniref:acylphosphatase n=1 Tax=Noviherbaspirillum denitrificans TaxID=1968433 RepID=A0A254TNZ1_9BURK|nr:acylphosphatase [Noviherbaspirillum denitrificans]OWW22343.1 acylphosphatase [Noviherbaspirillum denitrificans]
MATHLRISGLVQGVGYRVSFEAQARALQLAGWVRNRRDGSVEAVVDGAPDAVERITAWSRRGPAEARVTEVVVSEIDDASVAGVFEVRPTA